MINVGIKPVIAEKRNGKTLNTYTLSLSPPFNKGFPSMKDVYIEETGTPSYIITAATPTASPKSERRCEPRETLRETVGTSFYNNHELYNASVINLSSGGASLIFDSKSAQSLPELYPGRKMECYFSTPGGRSKCRGTVRWVRNNGITLTWGLSFLELSADRSDPFRTVISEVCRHIAA